MNRSAADLSLRQTRREWLKQAVATTATVSAATATSLGAAVDAFSGRPRTAGLVLGGLLGDALGGPVEFGRGESIASALPGLRWWPTERTVDADARRRLATSLPLLAYRDLRPSAEPYGPWRERAPAGTVTDDSRHKILLMRLLRATAQSGAWPVDRRSLAQAYLRFVPREADAVDAATADLCQEGLQEYRYAAAWLLGERDLEIARPLERLWAGTNNCSGQMLLLPLAAIYPGQPEMAYRAAFAIDFVDAPQARDFVSALVAALAAALDPKLDQADLADRWDAFFLTLSSVDPFGIADVPFAGRPLQRWLDRSEEFVDRAAGRPAELYRLLETEGAPVYWWDAHFTLLVPLTMLRFCQFDPLSALHLTLDFGHDTDSYAQVLGAIAGAVCGVQCFPEPMLRTMADAVRDEYSEDVLAWAPFLDSLAQRQKSGQNVIALL